MVAVRQRHPAGWEDAASALHARAQKVRVEDECARHLQGFARNVRLGLAAPPPADLLAAPVTAPLPAPRYYLGACACAVELWVHSARPHVPACDRCGNGGSR